MISSAWPPRRRQSSQRWLNRRSRSGPRIYREEAAGVALLATRTCFIIWRTIKLDVLSLMSTALPGLVRLLHSRTR